MSNLLDVLIVGAGVAGLTAAQTIHTKYSYAILEARDRPGGRVWTDKKLFPVPIDFGAHWIHTFWFNPLVKLALQHVVQLYPNEYQRSGYYKGGKRVERKIVKQARIRFNYVLTALEDGTWPNSANINEATREVLGKLTPTSEDDIIQQLVMTFMLHLVSDNSGRDLSDVNINNWKKEEEDFDVDGGDQLPEGGMWALFEKEFVNILPQVEYNCIVQAIDYSQPDYVRVESTKGTFHARHVIITVPIPLLKREKIKFSPSLPLPYQEAINSIKVGVLNCITIKFASTFWNEDDEFLFYLPDEQSASAPITNQDSPHVLIFNTLHHTLPGLLIAWTYGRQAASWETLSDQENLRRSVATLELMYGTVPPVEQYAVSRWLSDPFALGSYSAMELGYEEKQEILRNSVENRIFFAGEALAEKYGTVHGAYLNGREQGAKVLAVLEGVASKVVLRGT